MYVASIRDTIFFEKCLSYQYYSANEFLPVEKKNDLLNLKCLFLFCFSSERHSKMFNMTYSLKTNLHYLLSGNIWTSGNIPLLSTKGTLMNINDVLWLR